jgi:fatty-acyl-CoA synthase
VRRGISGIPAARETQIQSVPDEKWGERPLAMVVPKPDGGKKLEAEDLRAFLQKFVDEGLISKWGIPDRFLMVERIPKTSVGKIDKKVIKKGVAEGSL